MVEIAQGGTGTATLTTPQDTAGLTLVLTLIGPGGEVQEVGSAGGAAPGEEIRIAYTKPAPGRYRVEVKTTAADDDGGGSSEEEGLMRGTVRIVDYDSITHQPQPPDRMADPELNDFALYNYQAQLTRVIDGDTIVCKVDLGMYIERTVRLRLAGIDAIEISDPGGVEAKDALEGLLEGRTLYVATHQNEKSFDRYIADLYIFNDAEIWTDVSDWLVEEGWAEYVDY